ncbi:hypothetical protein ACO0LL_27495 [Undibacterium sp. TC4M20W]|uniref:hypothetical protein n=1 Tax=Undibacterium sp. TC4M20W TaxID=3413052 RepID=UPI003BF0565C
MKAYTPTIFALRQLLYRAIPLVVFLLIMLGSYLLIGKLLDTIFIILSSAGLALAYLAWFISAYSKGLIDTPRRQWQLTFEHATISINAVWGRTGIDLDAVKKIVLVSDDNWDQIIGMEVQCMKLVLVNGFSIIIPGSSANFDSTLEAIRQIRQVEEVLVN